jgi:hypothetical protein
LFFHYSWSLDRSDAVVNLWSLISVAVIIAGFVLCPNPMDAGGEPHGYCYRSGSWVPGRQNPRRDRHRFCQDAQFAAYHPAAQVGIGLRKRHDLRQRAQDWIGHFKSAIVGG